MVEDLDTSWINEAEKIEKMNQNYSKEPMEFIDIFFLYINSNSYIDKIICEKHPLLVENNKTSGLKKEYIIQLIQSKKVKTSHSKYKLLDVLVYNINLEPEHIQNYSNNENFVENSKGFLTVLPIIDDIKIPSSIFIFHGINSLFFLFQEKEFDISLIPKSILKTHHSSNHKTTKKVKLLIGGIDVSNNKHIKKKQTRKFRN